MKAALLKLGLRLTALMPVVWGLGLPPFCFSQPALKVGALVPFTGRWGDSGRDCARGFIDASKWLNQRGGVFGRKLDTVVMGDPSEPIEAMAAYRKLKEADRVLLLYLYSTETALTLHPHLQFDRIPTVVGSLPSPFANPARYPYLFSALPTPLDGAKIAMHYVSERSGIKGRKPKVIFMGSSDYSDQHFVEEARTYAKNLGLDVGPDMVIRDLPPFREASSGGSSTGNLSSFLTVMNQFSPDFVFVSLTPRETATVLDLSRKLGFRTRWIGNMRTFDETLASFDGVLGVQPVAPFGEDLPGMAGIREAHQKWHPHDLHTLSYVEGWATLLLIAQVLGESLPEPHLSPERMRRSFESFRNFVLGGLVPPITITPTDHRPSVESRILIIQNGRLARHSDFISLEREGK